MNRSNTLDFRLLGRAEAADHSTACSPARVLGAALPAGTGEVASWPQQRLATTVLAQAADWEERWLTGSDCTDGEQQDGLHWRRSGDLLYGVIELDEAAFTGSDLPALQAATAEAYRRLFALLDAQQLPQLWRTWNYMAAINADSHGLERYRQFNIGRRDAVLAAGRALTARLPAACALGFAGGPLSIAFLAGHQPIIAVENPRQMSAFVYPRAYGPRSPNFSRAALAHPPGQEILFISGTASIVGHRSRHEGDVLAQTRETLHNIRAVVDTANRHALSAPFQLEELHYRVYLRHAADQPAVASLLAQLLGPLSTPDQAVYLRADVCRRELLVEIEAQAIHRR